MDFVLWMAQLALKISLIAVGFWVFKTILKNGPDTIREIAETMGVLIRAGCIKSRRYIAENLRKERKQEQEPEPASAEETVEAEGSVE